MRVASRLVCLILFLPVALLLTDMTRADEKETVKFVIVAPRSGANAKLGASLYRVLLGNSQRARLERAETIDQAVKSKADVIVLAMASGVLPELEMETLQALKERKVVGIGLGAAKLFGQLGLEINEGQCADGTELPPTLMVTKSELLGAPKTVEPLLVFKETAGVIPQVTDEGERLRNLFAVFQPAREETFSAVDVVARWSSAPNYAPIVRQGNCVLIGISSPATQWSESYTAFVSEICLALHQRELEQFSTLRRELTKPGIFEFQLAPCQNADKAFDRSFYFQFDEPTNLHAQLEHSGSDAITLFFSGQGIERTHSERHDAAKGEALTIANEITGGDIVELDGRYWVLNVTNFDDKSQVSCKLTITVEKP